MRAVNFLGERHSCVVDLPEPSPKPDEVVVELRAAGLCGSDLEWYRAVPPSRAGRPIVPGHEPCGVVVAAGSRVSGWRAGQRVIVNHHHGCGTCVHCRRGSPKYCLGDHGTYGFTDDGADAQFMAAKASALIELDDPLSFEDGAAIACGVGTAYAALRRLNISGCDTLAIFGQGPVGLSATMLAQAMGARVVALEMTPDRLELAARCGAGLVVDVSKEDALAVLGELTGGQGADAALDCSGSPAGRVGAVGSVKVNGRVCFVGVGPPTSFDVSEEIIGKELTCHGSWTFTAAGLLECMDFLTRHDCDLSALVSHRWTIEQAPEAFAAFDSGITAKSLIVF